MKNYFTKLFLLAMAAGATALTAQADDALTQVGIIYGHKPVAFAAEGHAYISSKEYKSDYDTHHIYDENLNEVATVTGNLTSYDIVYCPSGSTAYDEEWVYFTQHLFNDDDLFEYIIKEDYAYKIMQSDGNCLATFDCSSSGDGDFDLILLGENLYLAIEYSDGYVMYKYDRNTNQMTSVMSEKRDRSNDVVIQKGEAFNLTWGDDAAEVTILALNGTVIRQLSANDGSASIITSDMAPGAYAYRVISSNGSSILSGRLIVK